MKTLNKALLILTSAMIINTPAWAVDGPVLEIKNFIGTIDVENTNAMGIEVTDADRAQVKTHGHDVLIDDGQTIKHANCKSTKSNVSIKIGKRSWKARSGYKDLSNTRR